jgi:hypothetical protein
MNSQQRWRVLMCSGGNVHHQAPGEALRNVHTCGFRVAVTTRPTIRAH